MTDRQNANRRHACSFLQAPAEQISVLLPWLIEGLRNAERVLLVMASDTADTWRKALVHEGIDVANRAGEKDLIVETIPEMRSAGEFNSLRMSRQMWSMIDDALNQHAGVRVLIDGQLYQDFNVPSDQLCHWEATLDYLVPADLPVQVVCLYDPERLPPSAVHAALRTHPTAILDGQDRSNPFLEAAAILQREPDLNQCSDDPELVSRMLQTLRAKRT